MSPVAIAIALGYGIAVLAVLGRRRLREPWLLVAFAAGALAFPVALLLANPIQLFLASIFGWDTDAFSTNLGIGLVGIAAAAIVNEVFTLAPALLVWSLTGERGDALAFGAASGAGFGIVGAYQVIQLALMARALPISVPSGFVTPLVQQFAFVAMHAAATALAAYGVAHRRIGLYLTAAVLCEVLFTTLGLLFTLRVYPSLVWTLLAVAAALALLAYAAVLGGSPTAAERPPAAC